jgi:hypothetical protein
MAHIALGGIVFLATLVLVMVRPRGVSEAVVAGAAQPYKGVTITYF